MKTLAFFFALMIPVFGRLGETLEECKGRYGEPKQVDNEHSSVAFQKSGFTLVATFEKGRVVYLYITKDKEPGKFAIGHPEMTDTEKETLLTANGGGSEWAERQDFDFVNEMRDTADKKRISVYNTIEHYFMFFTSEYAAKKASEKAAEEKKNLDGF